MQIFSQAFSAPKLGNLEEEYEDAFWCQATPDKQGQDYSFAVADGASEASFSGLWANMLVKTFGSKYTNKASIIEALALLQNQWLNEVNTKPLPWYAEEKLRRGAFSSFLGLYINTKNVIADGYVGWEAIAIGDSCLYQIRNDDLIVCFPINHSNIFNNSPILISSNYDSNIDLNDNLLTLSGTCKTDDSFYLLTDALACWFLQSYEQGEKPWKVLRDLDTIDEEKPFVDFITDCRKSKSIRNDDVTLLRIDIV